MAGLHPDEQAAGRRLPVTTQAPAAPAAAGAGSFTGVASASSSGHAGLMCAARSDGASPYPPGPAAAAAAVGAARVGAAPVYPAK